LPIGGEWLIYAAVGLPVGLTLRAGYHVHLGSAIKLLRRRDAKESV